MRCTILHSTSLILWEKTLSLSMNNISKFVWSFGDSLLYPLFYCQAFNEVQALNTDQEGHGLLHWLTSIVTITGHLIYRAVKLWGISGSKRTKRSLQYSHNLFLQLILYQQQSDICRSFFTRTTSHLTLLLMKRIINQKF
jgi:hypothetical protein